MERLWALSKEARDRLVEDALLALGPIRSVFSLTCHNHLPHALAAACKASETA